MGPPVNLTLISNSTNVVAPLSSSSFSSFKPSLSVVIEEDHHHQQQQQRRKSSRNKNVIPRLAHKALSIGGVHDSLAITIEASGGARKSSRLHSQNGIH
jgi:hypothetical protein